MNRALTAALYAEKKVASMPDMLELLIKSWFEDGFKAGFSAGIKFAGENPAWQPSEETK